MYLRTQFKLATGMYPCFSRDTDETGHLRGDDVKSYYGEWLEHIFYDGNKSNYLRSEFKKDTGEKIAVRQETGKNQDWLVKNYILWLEEFVLRSKMYYFE
jgi:hypothetical protein